MDLRKPGIPIPLEYAAMQLAERFGVLPWVVMEAPATEVLRWMNLMGLEAQYKGDLADLGPRDDMDWGDDT